MAVATSVGTRGYEPSSGSLQALDWLNLFLAALLAGFGPFIALYLTDHGWDSDDIGFILTASGLAGLATQLPAGDLLDRAQSKRTLVAIATLAVVAAAMVLALKPDFLFVAAASVLQGTTGSVIGPGVAAISLGLVGHDALAERLGRNQRFAAIGGLTAAGLTAAIGYLLVVRDVFYATAALGIPVLVALARIRPGDIHFGRSCGAPDHHSTRPPRAKRRSLLKHRYLLVFGGCLFLFQLANASLLPLAGEALARAEARTSPLFLSALIVVPQITVALLAGWAGHCADSWGRRPLLLIGFGIVPIRAALFATIANPVFLIAVQALDGLTGATMGVVTALVVADLTKGTGRFNLAQGLVGGLSGIGAAFSTSLSGLAAANFGLRSGFLGAAVLALAAVTIVFAFMPETRPAPAGGRKR